MSKNMNKIANMMMLNTAMGANLSLEETKLMQSLLSGKTTR